MSKLVRHVANFEDSTGKGGAGERVERKGGGGEVKETCCNRGVVQDRLLCTYLLFHCMSRCIVAKSSHKVQVVYRYEDQG